MRANFQLALFPKAQNYTHAQRHPSKARRKRRRHREPKRCVRTQAPPRDPDIVSQERAAACRKCLGVQFVDKFRIRFPNPFLPALRFTVGAGFLIIAAHERRHLWQAAVAISKQ